MSKSGWVIAALVMLLVVTNACWAYRVLDKSVSLSYLRDSFLDNKIALAQTLAVLHETINPAATRQTIIDAALGARGVPTYQPVPFEKEGFLYVGKIGLAFDEEGKLQGATRAWSPP